ncbi:aminoglycoside phosphotransferase family protein [Streptomyces scopuliridis]|uniref:phosphotransferase family protein n=1 Tax=Streptomyces scopuliridis TaxID=452529 RepID=UPI002DD95110|nr:aminoglycoside phosphotransferase family protein [Streptomyces scopuliridis]WSB38310.1 aminoglycoside phosphotransferase family protein [Streptomyces scopuliridis]
MGSLSRDRATDVRRAATTHLPGYRIDSVMLLGEGENNIAYEVNGELIVRFSKDPDPASRAAQVNDEARLLAAVAGFSPLPVPEPSFTVTEQGCLAYFKLPGLPLIDLPVPQRSAHARSIAATLGELLTALHRVPVGRMAELVDTDDQPKALWLREAAETYAAVAERVPMAYRPAVEAFLDAPPPTDRYAPVFSHNDLGIEHVLIDPAAWTVTGVIDWGDAAIVDPAYDFGLLYRDLGPAALGLALNSYRTDAHDLQAISARAAFYARCSVLEDMAYGIQTGHDKYLDKSLAALKWLYPAQAQ